MCGIVGHYGLNLSENQSKNILTKMCDTIVYRGPDSQGLYVENGMGIAMRRLSIIDLQGGQQPISSENGKLQVVCNGEIYNFQSLRNNLSKKGYSFKTSSDTEVILHQYAEDGIYSINKFNGMYGFALWDQKKKSLFLGRDRMGIKPLYYYWDGKQLLFASEIKALFASGLIEKKLNSQALWDYLSYRYVPGPQTIWNNIFKLPAAHTLTISHDHPNPKIEKYWDIPYMESIEPKSIDNYTEEFSDLFFDAVKLHLISDVPVGVLLSGGLDSSAVAAAIKEVHSSRLDSYSIAFQDSPQTNELPYARKTAEWVKTNHHEITIGKKEFIDFLPQFVHFTDEPLADLASVPLFYVSKLAANNVKVVLSGEGSDEIFGGYDFDRVRRDWDRLLSFQKLPSFLRSQIVFMSRFFGKDVSRKFSKANIPLSERLQLDPVDITHMFTSDQKLNWFKNSDNFRDSLDIAKENYKKTENLAPLHQALYHYCQSWLVEDLLMKADRMTMANSIELRVPFLDYRIVEWAAKTPPWVKVGKDKNGTYRTKYVLRQFAKKKIPNEILSRPKQGFPVPVYDWLKGPLRSWAHDLLSSSNTPLNDMFDSKQINEFLDRGTSETSTKKEQQELWQFLILELWLKEWMTP